MDRFLVRETRKTWRPIARTDRKPKKRQTTIESLSGVVSLDEIEALRDDLLELISVYVSGANIYGVCAVASVIGVLEKKKMLRRARTAKRQEQEMSGGENNDDSDNVDQEEAESMLSLSSSSDCSANLIKGTSSRATNSSSSTAVGVAATAAVVTPKTDTLHCRIHSLLTRLEDVRISLETLELTMVGKAVKKLTVTRNRAWPSEIAERARALVKKWKMVAKDGLRRRNKRKASGIDEPVVPHWKKAKLDYHFRGQ